MATTLTARFVAKIVDELQIEALSTSYALLDPTSTQSNVETLWQDWLAALDACTDGQIIDSWYTVSPTLPSGIKTAPVAGSRVEQTGLLNFVATGSSQRAATAIPALSNGATVTSGGKIVLTAGDPIPLFISLLLTGAALLEYTNDVGQALVSLRDTLISFRLYNRQLAAASYEV
jgi:hypothetical protein